MKNKIIIIFILSPLLILGQNFGLPLITNYYPADYHAESQIFDIAQDSLGKLYFSNTIGILEFDGRTWHRHELPGNAFPRNIEITKSGKFYTSGEGFIYKITIDDIGDFHYKSLLELLPESYRDFYTIWHMAANDSVLYLSINNDIVKITNDSICQIFKFEKYPYNFKLIDGYLYINQYYQLSIISPNGKVTKFKMDDAIPIGLYKKNDTIFFMNTNLQTVFIDKDKINFFHDISFQRYGKTYLKDFFNLPDNKYIFLTSNKGLYVLDSSFTQKSYLSVAEGLTSNVIYSYLIDNNGNLWIGTDNGISFIEFDTPLRILDKRSGITINSPTYLGRYNNKFVVYSGDNLITLNFKDSLQINRLDYYFQCWQGLQIDNDFYITSNPGLLKINRSNKITKFGHDDNTWSILKKDNIYIVSTNSGIYIYKKGKDTLVEIKHLDTLNFATRFLSIDTNNYIWASYTDGVLKFKLDSDLNAYDIHFYGPEQGLKNYATVQFFKWKDKFLFSTDKTIYEYDYQNDTIIPFYSLVKNFDISGNKFIYIVQIDSNQNIWVNYDDGVNYNYLALSYQNGKFIEKYPYTRRIQRAFLQIGVEPNITTYKNYVLFFSNEGIFILDTTKQNKPSQNFITLIKKVILTNIDSIIYTDYSRPHNINIKHSNNDIRFEFATPYYILPQRILYRYKLLNYDKSWSNWSNEIYTSYTNLPPGEYIFEVQSKNIYGQTSKISQLPFKILPPWYLTWWAYILEAIIFVLIILGAVKFFTFRLKRKNEKLEAIVKERTKEIMQKNSELEQQKEEILVQAEELAMVNHELEKLSTVVRETDNAVIITDAEGNFIWVNSAFTKMFGYSFDELVNRVSKNIVSDQTDPEIKKIVNKCLSEKTTVEYELKVRNKFNKEIWVHTTLTPILDDEGNITSLVAIDSDITDIKLAEQKIRQQRDQITASIRYAKSIQESILPQTDLLQKLFDIDIIYKPKDIVSGDFYWVSNMFKCAGNRLTSITKKIASFEPGTIFYFAVADCTGHGVPGAFMSLIGNHLLRFSINEKRIEELPSILSKMDIELQSILHRDDKQNMDAIALSLCRFEKITDADGKEIVKINFAGAGQDIMYYKKDDKKITRLKGSSREIGYSFSSNIEFTETSFILSPGDFLFLYSDGIKDLTSPDRKSFGNNRVVKILEDKIAENNDVSTIGKNLRKAIDEWRQNTLLRDDLTFISIQIK